MASPLPYTSRRFDPQAFAIGPVAAAFFAVAALRLFEGGIAVTFWVLAVIALLSPVASGVLSVRVDADGVSVKQGLWSNAEHLPVASIAAARVVDIPWGRRFLRAFVVGGHEVISAGGGRGVELRLSPPRKARFFGGPVDRLVLGSSDPEALLAAIETARATPDGPGPS